MGRTPGAKGEERLGPACTAAVPASRPSAGMMPLASAASAAISWRVTGVSVMAQAIDKHCMWTKSVHMKTASVRDLRNNFAMLEAWLGDGESVCIEKRGTPIAMLTAMPRTKRKTPKKTDFAARLKAIWGDRVFTEAEVIAMREAELEGEEG